MSGRFILCSLVASICTGLPARGQEVPRQRLRVAGIVLKWVRTDKQANYARVEPLIRQAAAGGADIVCTTESFLDGYAIDDKSIPLEQFRALGEPIPSGRYFQQLLRLADELDIHLIAGMLERDGSDLFNTAVVLGPEGKLLGKYHKQKLGHEAVRISPGSESSVVDTQFGRIGVMICADRRDSRVVSGFCTNGADLLICPSGGMYGPRKNDHILQARSRENGKTIVFVHPAEFLVTAPDGSIAQRMLLGDDLKLADNQLNTSADSSGVFYFDLERVGDEWVESRLTAPLRKPILAPDTPREELREYLEARIPPFELPSTLADWRDRADYLREEFLQKIVYQGVAEKWRDAPLRVEWFDTIEPGDGYRIKKFRYEALPGFWIPALLYEPTSLAEKAPVFINVNGHHRGGKAMPYKQRRCINLAKRGILAFNFEFIDQGQLYDEGKGNRHNLLVQMDLCGTSGLAPFFLTLKRGLDVALTHKHADPTRVGVAGLSGGGWQTIWLAALDTRITLANPVAGYCSTLARVRGDNNLGDAEQIPTDMCTIGDYTHLTAMVAPRALLLTYNTQDDCCFVADEILPELEQVGRSVFGLYDAAAQFGTHVNTDPGTHNFDRDNREALYRLVHRHMLQGEFTYQPTEIEVSDSEILTGEQLAVPMPADNATLHSLAVQLSEPLPRAVNVPRDPLARNEWQASARKRLATIVRSPKYRAVAERVEQTEVEGITVTRWKMRVGQVWTLPVVEYRPATPRRTYVVVGDQGRQALAATAVRLANEGHRAVAIDLLGFGESRCANVGNDEDETVLHLLSTVGARPLGIQAAQLTAIARWCEEPAPTIVAEGPRNCTIALVAAALESDAIAGLELHRCWDSLKELIRQRIKLDEAPEQFCFGLLREFDIPQLTALVADRPVRFQLSAGSQPSDTGER